MRYICCRPESVVTLQIVVSHFQAQRPNPQSVERIWCRQSTDSIRRESTNLVGRLCCGDPCSPSHSTISRAEWNDLSMSRWTELNHFITKFVDDECSHMLSGSGLDVVMCTENVIYLLPTAQSRPKMKTISTCYYEMRMKRKKKKKYGNYVLCSVARIDVWRDEVKKNELEVHVARMAAMKMKTKQLNKWHIKQKKLTKDRE